MLGRVGLLLGWGSPLYEVLGGVKKLFVFVETLMESVWNYNFHIAQSQQQQRHQKL